MGKIGPAYRNPTAPMAGRNHMSGCRPVDHSPSTSARPLPLAGQLSVGYCPAGHERFEDVAVELVAAPGRIVACARSTTPAPSPRTGSASTCGVFARRPFHRRKATKIRTEIQSNTSAGRVSLAERPPDRSALSSSPSPRYGHSRQGTAAHFRTVPANQFTAAGPNDRSHTLLRVCACSNASPSP